MDVLFIGNSHTYYNDMPRLFQTLCFRTGAQTRVTMLTRGGTGLDWHLSNEQTRFNILYGGYDVVVLQHKAHPMGEERDMFDGARGLMAFISQAGARAVLYQTWAERGDEGYQPVMSERYARLGAALGAQVAPVGDAWQLLQREHPELDLFSDDGRHASPLGSLLAAHVLYQTIVGVPAPCDTDVERALSDAAARVRTA